ncbi:MAG: FAD-binding oxidoreductase [Gammaproteobacteria bacterium]|nr:FAD-binding oxidoreductase [Gammaproteobacteria bacterium]
MQTQQQVDLDTLISSLVAIVGADHVLTDAAELAFYATDIYAAGKQPRAVVQPASTDEVVALAQLAGEHGLSLVPRGGGASYTDGYLPTQEHSLLIDTSRMDAILDLNEEDMYVTVQTGVPWAKLNDALKPLGLRTPFYGPFSGLHATVGGGVSQNSVSWGTGTFGVSAESVLGVEVVLAGGELLRTGSWGTETSTPFFRHYGPDLTGLFTGDNGALGIKTAISLRLIRRPPEFIGLSFKFPDFDSMHQGMTAAAKLGINTINFGLDPTLQQGQLGKTSTSDAMAAALAVFKTSRNPIDGLVQVARMGMAGKRFLSAQNYSCHYIVEGIDRASVKSSAAAIRNAVAPYGAETANTIPNVVYAMPFAPFYNVLGPKGERWVPIHCLLPFSRAVPFRRDLEQLYARHENSMREHKIQYGAMFLSVSTNAFLYEPVFYWEDERNACIDRMVPADYLAQLPTYPPNPQGRALVAEMKQEIIDLMHQHGAAHFQIGKLYPYLADRNAAAVKLLRDIKAAVDPKQGMNPGALGL